jgi:hypothetical protein
MLVDEHVLGPAELADHTDVEFAFRRVLALAHDDQIVSPGYFSNQWLEFLMTGVFQIKLAHVPEVLHRKISDSGKLPPQVRGQASKKNFRLYLSCLFCNYNMFDWSDKNSSP